MRYYAERLTEYPKYVSRYSVVSFDLYDTLIFRTESDYDYREHIICKRMSDYLNKIPGVKTNEGEVYFIRVTSFSRTKK